MSTIAIGSFDDYRALFGLPPADGERERLLSKTEAGRGILEREAKARRAKAATLAGSPDDREERRGLLSKTEAGRAILRNEELTRKALEADEERARRA